LQSKTRFEAYLVRTLKKICSGMPYNRKIWNARLHVYLQMIARGIDPEKARATMDMYLD